MYSILNILCIYKPIINLYTLRGSICRKDRDRENYNHSLNKNVLNRRWKQTGNCDRVNYFVSDRVVNENRHVGKRTHGNSDAEDLGDTHHIANNAVKKENKDNKNGIIKTDNENDVIQNMESNDTTNKDNLEI